MTTDLKVYSEKKQRMIWFLQLFIEETNKVADTSGVFFARFKYFMMNFCKSFFKKRPKIILNLVLVHRNLAEYASSEDKK